MPQPLFKRKGNRVKKGVQAIVLVTTAASVSAFPSLFSFLPLPICLKQKFSYSHKKQEDHSINVTARRAHSMCVLPSKPIATDDDDFGEFEIEASQLEAHRAGLLLAMEQMPSKSSVSLVAEELDSRYSSLLQENVRYHGLAHPKICESRMLNRTQPHHPLRSRRIQSAPSVALQNLPQNLLDDLDAWDTDDFTLNEWVVPQVRDKALRQQQNHQQIEDWDEDFEVLDQDVEIPVYMQTIQMKFKSDMLHMRQFALHIQDLKLIYESSESLKNGLKKEFPDEIEMIELGAQDMMEQIQLLIRLADWQEDNGPSLSLDDFKRLSTILCRSDLLKENSIEFGNEIMSLLLGKISPLKKDLVDYISQIRELISI